MSNWTNNFISSFSKYRNIRNFLEPEKHIHDKNSSVTVFQFKCKKYIFKKLQINYFRTRLGDLLFSAFARTEDEGQHWLPARMVSVTNTKTMMLNRPLPASHTSDQASSPQSSHYTRQIPRIGATYITCIGVVTRHLQLPQAGARPTCNSNTLAAFFRTLPAWHPSLFTQYHPNFDL